MYRNMAYLTRVWVYLGFSTICVSAGLLTGKAFYCRDPDTGKLHAVNSTWPSSSFCGNYTCKLKKINITEMEYVPLRQLNISNIDILSEYNHTTEDIREKSNQVTFEKKFDTGIQHILHRDMVNDEPKLQNTKTNNDDRYLTEAEIKTISEMLHTVKKSDLDAIVDLYNIAQDIYKEMDKATTENAIDETMNTIRDVNKVQYNGDLVHNKYTSYWYEPVNNNILKAKPEDMIHEGSNVIQTTVPPRNDVRPSYFTGALNSNDFGKLPYYYPLSSFQRQSSYVHQPRGFTKPCEKAIDHALINNVLRRQHPMEQRLIQPSILLPYPFSYVHNHNTSGYLNNFYYGTNPWSQIDFYKSRNYPYAAYVAQLPNDAMLIDPRIKNRDRVVEQNSVSKEESKILDTLIAKVKESKIPNWQTPPLPDHVLEEVRANIEKSQLLKPLSFRKKINLERVGKLIKLDEIERSKRDIEAVVLDEPKEDVKIIDEENNEIYDVHLETITCESDTKPGYFRMGDLSQPYPSCCPQRISSPVEQ